MYLLALGAGCLSVSLWCAKLNRKYLNNRKLPGSLSQGQVQRSHQIDNGAVRAPFWDGEAFPGAEAAQGGWEALIPFCSILPAHTPGWTALLTGLIFSLPQSALLSCLRLEPAAAEACIYSAWGLNLLLFPSSSICSFQAPPVCLLWQGKKAFPHLRIPPLVSKTISGGPLPPPVWAQICPSSCWVEFSSGTWIPKSISICSKRTDLTARRPTGTWALSTYLKEKLTNRNGDVPNTNDTESQRL